MPGTFLEIEICSQIDWTTESKSVLTATAGILQVIKKTARVIRNRMLFLVISGMIGNMLSSSDGY